VEKPTGGIGFDVQRVAAVVELPASCDSVSPKRYFAVPTPIENGTLASIYDLVMDDAKTSAASVFDVVLSSPPGEVGFLYEVFGESKSGHPFRLKIGYSPEVGFRILERSTPVPN
jgi:hypothetical protein